MHWIRSYSNYGWQIREPCWTGCLPFKAFTSFSCFLPWPFSPRLCGRVEEGSLLQQTSQAIKSDGSYLKAGPQVRTCSDYLRAIREAEKEDSIELPQSSRTQTADGPPNQGLLAFSPWGNLRVTSHLLKSLQSAWHIWRKRMQVMVKTQRVMILV